ncbi:helix-turn-helix domain-containing protein [Clostridium lundense]|uniref:helix-turn-helix domain-containing protein n=1 Tax=Clostridium lundense TaxID=319475 RepID=UPI000488ABCF
MVLGVEKDIIDRYCKYIEEEFGCKTSDEILGKKYIIGEKFGMGNFSRMKIEDGVELSIFHMYKADTHFDNSIYEDDILEISYCYSGTGEIMTFPHKKKYAFKEGQICIYKGLNDVDYFKFKYDNCKTVSVHMNFNTIKNVINPIWEDKIIIDWQNNINEIFKGDILVIENASCEIKKIAEEIDSMVVNNMLDYMKLKLKVMELLATFFGEKCNKKSLKDSTKKETEIIIASKEIISKSLQNTPSVKELASSLDISIYKLQEEFKNITGDTVYEYIKKLRIEKGKQLLKNTDMTILEVANEIGYENPSKFASVFKQYNDITPLKYRKLNISK